MKIWSPRFINRNGLAEPEIERDKRDIFTRIN